MGTPLRRHAGPLGLWTLLWILFFATFLLGLERFSGGDISGQFHAFGLFQAREIAQGQFPLWSPGSFAGIPFAADTQAAAFYPPRYLTILLSLPWHFPYYALELEVLLHVWLAGVFTYGLGYAITRQRLAGLVAAVAFGLGGYLASYPLSQLAILETITWLPLVLLLLRLGSQRQKPVPWLVAALVLALSALAGHPQTFLHISYVAAAYYLFLAWQAGWPWQRSLSLGLMVAAIAVGTAAVAWLPAVRFVANTVRSDVGYAFVATGAPLLETIHTLVPGVLGDLSPVYLGLPALALAIMAWLGRRQRPRAEIVFWAGAAFLAAWLALGDKGILFELVYHAAPGFALFRQQERLLGLFSFSSALLAAQGLAIWLKVEELERRRLVRDTAAVLGGGLLLAGFILALASPIIDAAWWLTWWRQAGITAVVLGLLWRGRREAHWPALILVGLLAADLYLPSLAAIERQPGSPAAYWPQPAWVSTLKEEDVGRIDSSRLFFANVGEIYGLEDIRGISPLKPQVLADLEQLPRPRLWQLLNVTHALTAVPPQAAPLQQTAVISQSLIPNQSIEVPLYRFEAALPRTWMSYQPVVVAGAEAALELLHNPTFDPARDVVLHGPITGLEGISSPATPPQVAITRHSPRALEISVDTETAGLLVVSEWAYPGWQASLDGRRVPLHTADYALQVVQVPAGQHTVQLNFVPPDVVAGVVISLLTLVAAGIVAWRWQPVVLPRDRRHPARLPEPALRLKRWLFEIRQTAATSAGTKSSARWRWRWTVLGVVLLGFGLRLFLLGHQELRGDEAFSYLFARLPAADIVPALLQEGDPHSPFHYLLLHGWMQLAGESEFAMRFLSLVPGVLLLPLMAQLGCYLGSRRLGLLAAVLAAISQSLVWVAQDVRNQYTLALLWIALATLLLVRATEKGKTERRPTAVGLWAAYAVSAALAVYSHYYAAFALLGHGLFLWLQPRRRQYWQSWIVSGVTAVLLFLPWFIPMWPRLVAAGQLSEPQQPELATYLTTVGTELTVGSAFGYAWARWLFLGGLALCLLGARALWTRRRHWAVFLLTWLGSTALMIYLIRFSRATFNAFYITLAAPAWWLLVAAGLMWLWQQRRRWRRGTAAAALLALSLVTAVSLRNYYFDPAYSRTIGYRSMAAQVASQTEAGDLFLAHFPDPSLDYYLRDVPLPRRMQPATAEAPAPQTEQALAQLAADYERLWFVPYYNSVWDREEVVPRWLEYHTLREQVTQHRKLTLAAYRPLHAVNDVVTPIGVSLNGSLRLQGAYVTVNGVPVDLNQPVSISPGSAVDVTLVWQALQPIPDHYTVFVHLLDENGALVAQHDGIPVLGTRPTATWEANERLLDWHPIAMPAEMTAGDGRIVVGLYQTETLRRQTFANGQDAVPIATVRFQ